jgi:hypothetical protein
MDRLVMDRLVMDCHQPEQSFERREYLVPKESRGQKVKSFTIYVPGGANVDDREKTVMAVYFQAKESMFYAYLPEHIAKAIGHHPDAPEKLYHGAIRTPLADEVEPGVKAAFDLYEKIQRNTLRKKVLLVDIKANFPGVNRYVVGLDAGRPGFDDISFAFSPALAFTYETYWLVGDCLYRSYKRDKDSDLEEMTYVTKAPSVGGSGSGRSKSRFMLDWTEEREQFLSNIHQGLVVLIERLWQLLSGDTQQNVDRLIAGGGNLMLPAPQREDA